jgi:hypothetical protein
MRVSHEWGGGAAASRPRDRVEMRSPPRDALEIRAHRRPPTHAHMYARTPTHHTPHMHTCMRMPCSTAAARRCDFRGSYAGCFGWECARRAGSPRKGRGRRHAPPPPFPMSHTAPPRCPCTMIGFIVSCLSCLDLTRHRLTRLFRLFSLFFLICSFVCFVSNTILEGDVSERR